jgi:hypothetical protein
MFRHDRDLGLGQGGRVRERGEQVRSPTGQVEFLWIKVLSSAIELAARG